MVAQLRLTRMIRLLRRYENEVAHFQNYIVFIKLAGGMVCFFWSHLVTFGRVLLVTFGHMFHQGRGHGAPAPPSLSCGGGGLVRVRGP
eukprot:5966806-Pyramimonas_sp.AAC.1